MVRILSVEVSKSVKQAVSQSKPRNRAGFKSCGSISCLWILALGSTILGTSCEKSSEKKATGIADLASTAVGLALTTTDYTSSKLFYNDFSDGSLRTVLDGESGDPEVKWAGDELWFFNRTTNSLNFRHFDVRDADATIPKSAATPLASVGDPHAILVLPHQRVLLGHYNSGMMVVLDSNSGEQLQEVKADWDLGDGANSQLRPQLFFQTKEGGDQMIYMVHQGIDKSYVVSDGTQQVFVLEDDGTTITVKDQDSAKAKVQGIALSVSHPAVVIPDSSTSVILGGTCNLGYTDNCTSGFERIVPSTGKTEMLLNLDDNDFKGNGNIVAGESNHEAYALMAKSSHETIVAHIDFSANLFEPVFTFPADSSGCCSLFFDQSSKTLYVGDARKDLTGVLHILEADGTARDSLSLPAAPYSGAFVYESTSL